MFDRPEDTVLLLSKMLDLYWTWTPSGPFLDLDQLDLPGPSMDLDLSKNGLDPYPAKAHEI